MRSFHLEYSPVQCCYGYCIAEETQEGRYKDPAADGMLASAEHGQAVLGMSGAL